MEQDKEGTSAAGKHMPTPHQTSIADLSTAVTASDRLDAEVKVAQEDAAAGTREQLMAGLEITGGEAITRDAVASKQTGRTSKEDQGHHQDTCSATPNADKVAATLKQLADDLLGENQAIDWRLQTVAASFDRAAGLQAVVFKQMLAHEQFKGLSGVAEEVHSLISRLRKFIEVVRSSVDAVMNADPDLDDGKVIEILEAVEAMEQTFTDQNSEILRLFPEEDPTERDPKMVEMMQVNTEDTRVGTV